MKVHNFKELKVWQKAMDLTVRAYMLTALFPKEERYGLIAQIQRAVVSIPSNLAEGCGRVTNKDLQHFVSMSMGSCYEVETQMILAYRFKYVSVEDLHAFEQSASEVQKMLFGFYNSLNNAESTIS
jgi:four helix bundle protein